MNSPIDEVDDKTTADSTSETEEETSGDTATDEGTGSEEEGAPKRNAETRINELLARNKELEKKLDYVVERMAPPPPRTRDEVPDPDKQKAREYLRQELKVVTKEDLDERLQAIEDRQALQSEHSRLGSAYDGSDGRPKYSKAEVEEYMRQNGVYNPEVAYRELHRAELFDWELKKLEEKKKQRPYVEKQGSTVNRDDNTITREKIAEWMKTPEGRAKYEQNRDKILKLMQQGAL